MSIRILENRMNTPLAEGIPRGISLRQPTEDFCNHFLKLNSSCKMAKIKKKDFCADSLHRSEKLLKRIVILFS